MTLSIIFLTLAVLFLLYKALEDRFIAWQKNTDERISTVEGKTTALEDLDFKREAKHSRVVSFIKRLRRDVNAIGRDVGWKDDLHVTQVSEKKDPEKPDDGNSA